MATIYGTSGSNTISGTDNADAIYGLDGDDVIAGGKGSDSIYGGKGADEIDGGAGKDQLFGGEGDDLVNGGAGDDLLIGATGDDILIGGAGNDIIDGGAGDDILTGGAGSDGFVFSGSFGDDIITKLDSGDTIDLTSFSAITDVSQLGIQQVGSGVQLNVPGGGTVFIQNATVAQVTSLIEVACLVRGSMVKTPAGEVPVESLAIGDLVLTVDGTAEPVKWIGRRGYSRSFVEASERLAPVLFTKGALGVNTPSRDLYVSPEHAVLIDHALVPAAKLVNGTTIRQVTDFDMVEYFHIEFEAPQVIFTDGAATESYVNHDNRRMFQNYQDYVDLYGNEGVTTSRLRRFDFIEGGVELDAIRARLTNQARIAA